MAETVQKNFRMSSRAIKLLHDVARARGMTETEVVETCVAKYALEIGEEVDRAKELLFRQICGAAAKAPISQIRRGESLAMNEGSRHEGREGRKDVAAEAGTAQSPAGGLAAMAGESWSEGKKEKGKRKG